MNTYYAIANASGMISKKIEANCEHEALKIAEASGRDWIDDPATDFEDAHDFDGADKSAGECDEALEAAGLSCLIPAATDTDWEIWG